jgi:type IV pilus assembly protein PilE
MDRLNAKGFTLIELMIVISLLGILASIAVPIYNDYTRKAHRASAKSALMEDAQAVERYFTTANTYVGAPVAVAATEGGKYTITLSGTSATGFLLTATPTGSQTADPCGTLTINQLGAKTPTTGNCW